MAQRVRPLRRAADIEDRFWRALEEVIPPRTRAHLRNARREVLLAIRELLDYAIARAEAQGSAPRKPRRVKVE